MRSNALLPRACTKCGSRAEQADTTGVDVQAAHGDGVCGVGQTPDRVEQARVVFTLRRGRQEGRLVEPRSADVWGSGVEFGGPELRLLALALEARRNFELWTPNAELRTPMQQRQSSVRDVQTSRRSGTRPQISAAEPFWRCPDRPRSGADRGFVSAGPIFGSAGRYQLAPAATRCRATAALRRATAARRRATAS